MSVARRNRWKEIRNQELTVSGYVRLCGGYVRAERERKELPINLRVEPKWSS